MKTLYIVIPKNLKHSFIQKGSGVVASVNDNQDYILDFEGNLYNAENLKEYGQRVYHAASRQVHGYPTVARQFISNAEFQEKFLVVGTFDHEKVKTLLQLRPRTFQSEADCIAEGIQPTFSSLGFLAQWVDLPADQLPAPFSGHKPADPNSPTPVRILVTEIAVKAENALKVQKLFQDFVLGIQDEIIDVRHTYPTDRNVTIRTPIQPRTIWSLPSDQEVNKEALEEARRLAAEDAFSAHVDAENLTVAESDGWERCGNHWERTYYIEEEGESSSTRKTFSIEFKENESIPI